MVGNIIDWDTGRYGAFKNTMKQQTKDATHNVTFNYSILFFVYKIF